MKRLSLIILLCFISVVSYAKEPKNLSLYKHQLMEYHDSGDYEKDQAKVIDQAMLYLKNRLEAEKRKPTHKKFAVVLDIDETALSNYSNMITLNFGGTFDEINALAGQGVDPAISSTLKLFQYAKENHLAIFFLTGRLETYKEKTILNLENAGYKNWDGIFFKPDHYTEKTASIFKIAQRKQIEKDGYDIILNIGDQQSDLVGKHADKAFKLPNPYYIVP